jgi:hypothetical protein
LFYILSFIYFLPFSLSAIFVPKEYGGNPPEDMDTFFELIMIDEVARVGGGGALGQVRDEAGW